MTTPTASGAARRSSAVKSTEAGRLAGHPHLHVRTVRPQRPHHRRRLLATGVTAVEPDAEVGEVAERGGRVDAADAVDVLDDVRRPALQLVGDRGVGALRDDGDGRGRREREVGALGGEELPLLVLDGQQVLGRAAHRQLQHRGRHQPEHHEHRDDHPPGVPLDAAGEPAEEALVRRDVAETPHQRTDPGHPVQRARVHQAVRTQREQRRHQGQRDQQRDRHDRQTGGPGAGEDRGVEEEEPAEADAHRHAAEHDRAAGRGHRPAERGGAILASGARGVAHDGPQLVAEPADHQQPVVDAQAEPEHGDDVDHGGVEVDEVREAEQRGEAAGDRGHRPEDRDARREEPAEHHDHHQQRHRQRDALTGAQVLLDLVVDGVDQLGEAADLRASHRARPPAPPRRARGAGPGWSRGRRHAAHRRPWGRT